MAKRNSLIIHEEVLSSLIFNFSGVMECNRVSRKKKSATRAIEFFRTRYENAPFKLSLSYGV